MSLQQQRPKVVQFLLRQDHSSIDILLEFVSCDLIIIQESPKARL